MRQGQEFLGDQILWLCASDPPSRPHTLPLGRVSSHVSSLCKAVFDPSKLFVKDNTIRQFLIMAISTAMLPMGANASSTVVMEGGGPFVVQTDNLFYGIVLSDAGGAGSYINDFTNTSGSIFAVADAAVTNGAVDTLFTDLTISWLDGATINSHVQAAGIDALSTVFSGTFQSQRLAFDWEDYVAGAGFGFDVTISEVPVPGALSLFFSALFGLGLASRSRRNPV